MSTAWADLSWDERNYTILEELQRVRAGLSIPAPTRVVADRIARATGWRSDDIGKVLVRNYAKEPYAQQDGGFVRFGRRMKRWVWMPVSEITGQTPDDLIA